MYMKYSIFLLVFFLIVTGCKDKSHEVDDSELKKEFDNHAMNYMAELKSVLLENMKAGGPLQAANVCSDTAAEMTASFSVEMGVDVKRFSHKNRNSQNFPIEHENEILSQFENLMSNNELTTDSYFFEEMNIDGRETLVYAKPIFISAPCLNCHGEQNQIGPDVKAVINERYPNDKATNYKIGDLRGAISVTKVIE